MGILRTIRDFLLTLAVLQPACAVPVVQRDFTLARRADLVPNLSGDPVAIGAGTYPRAIRIADGSLLAAVGTTRDGQSETVVLKSTDNGGSWDEIGSVVRGVGDIANGQLMQAPSGRLLCAFRNNDKDASGAYTYFRITVCSSEDGGKTWSYLSTPAEDSAPGNGKYEPYLRMAGDVIQVYWSNEFGPNDQDTLMKVSNDNGETWGPVSTVTGGGITGRDGMVSVAEFPGGDPNHLILMMESFAEDGTGIKSSESFDNGQTWTNRRMVLEAPPGRMHRAPWVALVGDTLVASFQTDEDIGPNQQSFKVITSSDGLSWGNKVTITGPQSWWGSVCPLDGNSFLALVEHDGARSQLINLS